MHSHTHDNHGHHHAHSSDRRVLALSLAVIFTFMLAEFVGGSLFGSLALVADAGHMANDAFSLVLALIALYVGAKWQKIILFVNGLSLIAVAVYILSEAYQRFYAPVPLEALPTILIAVFGLFANLAVAYLMHGNQHDSLNIKAAYLHVLADLFGSVAVIVSGVLVYFWGLVWIDMAISLLLAAFVLKSGVGVVRMALGKEQQAV